MSGFDVMTDSAFSDGLQWSLVPNKNPNVATEDHLQSLGLNVQDGLPKFKLNEVGPVALASSIFQKNYMNVDGDSEQSFVVLGETSLQSIRDDALASYTEIQQKSQLADHTSMISMMSPSEIEEKLKNALEENIKLKETLKQNNSAIKQQFNTITMWQKDVMTVCDNHKQKFMETKKLMSHLKKVNDELRENIANYKNQLQKSSLNSSSATGLSLESVNAASLLNKSTCVSAENLPILAGFNTSLLEEEKQLENNKIQLENEQELLKKIDTLTEELNKVKVNHSKTKEVLQELEKRYVSDIELFSQQLQKANKELKVLKQKSDMTNSIELEKLLGKCCEKDLELKYLEEIITSLKQQIKKYEENIFPLIDLQVETSDESSDDTKLLKENVEFYNNKIEELGKCFAAQCSRYMRIQEFLKESADIIQIFENSEVLSNSSLPEDKVKDYKEKLREYRKRLIDEQIQSIDDKQTTIKVQKQFQKMLSDYNAVIYELEILKDENLKLATMQTKASEENSQKLADIEKHLDEEKKILDNEKTELLEQRLSLQFEKKLVIEEKEKIEGERSSLSLEKEKLIEARTSLLEERTSLDRQSQLYEAEEGTLQKEKKLLQKKCDELMNQIEILRHELSKANTTIQQLNVNNSKLKENEEIISVYKIQTEMHQKEFEEMRVTQKNLQDQLQSLSMANLQLRTENDRLGGQANEQDNSDVTINRNRILCPKCQNSISTDNLSLHIALQSRYCGLCAKYIVPGERHGMGICTPEFD
ncbi:hypothetical protein TSAR_003512 [Trichomalopsis sarcophagae]|uniref:Uncharacterized protein n=1 Tax=Trichomalopsis sarcophagae TaxID=543379 RepID=A0A232F491_9HYME|nr:hypothetical protein TSAR_003512 [Trichomalopsis sarcophagae]